ncbi:MAG: hypothetical protein ACE5FG_10665 [Myxococcota bacterium]
MDGRDGTVNARIACGFLLGMAILACAERTAAPSWERYTNEELGFSVLVPGDPIETHEELPSDLGTIHSTVVSAEPPGDALRYLVRADRFPPQIQALRALIPLVEARHRRHEQRVEGKTLELEAIHVGDVPGREVMIELPDGTLERARFLMHGSVIYHLGVRLPPDERERPEIRRFLDSFELPDEPVL